MSNLRVTIITVSDTCSAGKNIDTSGPYLVEAVKKTFPEVDVKHLIIPDDITTIQNSLLQFSVPSDKVPSDLIITTGGTGFTKRDVTPEATLRVIQKHAPGITTAMCMKSLQITDMAMLSRSVCGINQDTLIINFPGSLKAVRECYQVIERVLPHAINQIKGETCLVKATHHQMKSKNVQQGPHQPQSHCCLHKSGDHNDGVAYRHRVSTYPMIGVDRALDVIVECLKGSIQIESIPICVGQICMEDITAPEPYPPFRASIKDGYACISTDGKGVRKVRDGVTAGEYNETPVREGECVRISTGAAVPLGADCVVQVEDTKLLKHSEDGKIEYEIEIMSIPQPGQDIRQVGSDIQKGETILYKNMYIGPAELGLLHSFGIGSVNTIRKIRVGILSTGNEVRDSNTKNLEAGCIRDSNKPMLMSLLSDYADCLDLGVVSDEKDLLYNTLHSAFLDKQCDIVITSGGVSMGEKDLLKNVLTEQLPFQILFGRVNMKPGKPTTFASGTINSVRKSVFGLPGNPVSAYVTCNLFVIPTLKALMGKKQFHWPRINVEIDEDVKLDSRPEYARASFVLDHNKSLPVATIIGNQISSRLTSLVGAQVLLELPSSSVKGPTLPKGSMVSALLIKNI